MRQAIIKNYTDRSANEYKGSGQLSKENFDVGSVLVDQIKDFKEMDINNV